MSWERNFAASQVVTGDAVLWCNLTVKVLAVLPEKQVWQRRGGISGRLFRVALPNGEERDLHYFNDERVVVVIPHLSTEVPKARADSLAKESS